MADKPTTAAGYRSEHVALVRATCLYVATKLSGLMDELVVVGGLVPSLLVDQETLPPGAQVHVGTMDLDVGVTLALLDEGRYRTLTEALRRAGFGPDMNEHGNRIQAVDNFRAGPGNEEAWNGQLRNLLDVVLPLVCERLSGKQVADASGAIQHLHNERLLDFGLFDLLRGIYKLSNTRGAHVGLSDSDEALFRLHVTTATVRYLLRLERPA